MPKAPPNQRVFITQSDEWVGPALAATFSNAGYQVATSNGRLDGADAVENAFDGVEAPDVLIAHLVATAPSTYAQEVGDDEWQKVFGAVVDPLPRLCRRVLPRMIERKAGKIIVIGSAAGLRGMPRASTYCAARGAQVAYVKAVGAEVARHNIQVNLIAANFLDSPTYFPEEVKQLDAFQNRLKRDVPRGQLGTPEELAEFALFLASDKSNHITAQAIPFAGGWSA